MKKDYRELLVRQEQRDNKEPQEPKDRKDRKEIEYDDILFSFRSVYFYLLHRVFQEI